MDEWGTARSWLLHDRATCRTSLTLPNGVVATTSYDAASQLTGINYQGGALTPQNLAYSYDLAGRRVGVSGTLASTQLPAAVASAVYNANNQLTQWGSTAMTYDLNGNTLNDGTNSYSWDARNRMVSADGTGASFTYDPLGRRVSKTVQSTTTNFLYDGENAVQEFGTNPTANLLTGGVDERFTRTSATETDNYLTDALGSTVALTGSTGVTQEQYSYGPYGILSASGGGSTTNSYAYTGRETDGLGVDYYRARYYNPTTGRFLSEDPLGFVGGFNLYQYVKDNPMSLTDPFGTCPITCTDLQVAAAAMMILILLAMIIASFFSPWSLLVFMEAIGLADLEFAAFLTIGTRVAGAVGGVGTIGKALNLCK